MRVVDLLITESEMLLESYRDFSRIWEDYVSEIRRPIQGVTISQLKTVPSRLEKLLKDNQTRATMVSALGNRKFGDIRNIYDVGSWISGIRSAVARDGVEYTLIEYHGAVEIIEDHTKAAIIAKTPVYTAIKKTSDYIIFDVKNFAASQKLRNQVKSTWCIGASEDYFKQYGEDKDRKTIIVFFLKKKEGMVFHVDKSGSGLITSHDNDREWTVGGGSFRSSRGYREFSEELRHYLYQNELVDFVKATGMRIKPEHLAPYGEKNEDQ